MLKMLLVNKTGQPYSVQDIRALQKKLRDIEPKLRREFLREVKTIGKEPEKAIRNAIPNESPLSGMNPATRGRNATLQWGKVTKGAKSGGAKSTTIRFRTQAGGKSLTATLLGIRVNSAASSVADYAGRTGRYIGKGYKASGYSKLIRRTYKDGSQSVEFRRQATAKGGQAFIRNLNEQLGNSPSRMAWKAIEKSLPATSKSIQFVIDKWIIQYMKGF
jgi:hypothetical protein